MNIQATWYEFSKKLPLYECMYLVEQLNKKELDRFIKQLKELR